MSGFEKRRTFKLISFITKWSLLIFIPFVTIPLSVWLEFGIITAEGVCGFVISAVRYDKLSLDSRF